MTNEESAIVNLLHGSPEGLVMRKELARKARWRRVFEENTPRADALLSSLLSQIVIEDADTAQFLITESEVLP